MKKVLAVGLAVLLLAIFGSLPAFASSEASPDTQVTEEEKKEEEDVITIEDMKAAKLIPSDAITIELGGIEEEIWRKYLYFDVSEDLNDNSQTFWTSLGASKGDFDISVGWSQRLNEPEDEPQDKGTASVSFSIWW